MGCTTCLLIVLGAVIWTFAPQLISLFNSDPEIIRYGADRTAVCALFYCLLGFSHTASSVMRGLGKPMTPMLVMLICWCAVRVLTLMTLGQIYHNILLVIWIYPITWFLSAVVYVFYMSHLRRQGLY